MSFNKIYFGNFFYFLIDSVEQLFCIFYLELFPAVVYPEPVEGLQSFLPQDLTDEVQAKKDFHCKTKFR